MVMYSNIILKCSYIQMHSFNVLRPSATYLSFVIEAQSSTKDLNLLVLFPLRSILFIYGSLN